MQSKATTVAEYLKSLTPERRKDIEAVRKVILRNLPKGYEENIRFGMICYEVPLSVYPETYNGQPLCYAGLASQKNYISVYLMSVYGDKRTEKWFKEEYKKSGKKLDMGKSCVRFRKVEDLPLNLIGKAIKKDPMEELIKRHETVRAN